MSICGEQFGSHDGPPVEYRVPHGCGRASVVLLCGAISGWVVKSKQPDAQGHEGYATFYPRGEWEGCKDNRLAFTCENNGTLSQKLMATSANKGRKADF